ncbi:hydroxyethylthiazole kinase [Caryophanon tenue]|uniref:Hydroxyethylthiazole kinase n=1 Tax=Caryophanon tenue TaxID=33978 RepID=A0A1C0YDF2_9BACL|nr:hydroxyethylthiazole kinase [Caryophanon tenue]OCS85208.1 hydroxyethylthiazole kinase [Caryophanon tenue]
MSLQAIYKKQPLVHCITNYVVANFTANGLLAIGASPVMADAVEEAADMAKVSDALLINIGTLRPHTVEAMVRAGQSANAHHVPVVLDPVGVGATAYRLETVRDLLAQIQFQAIRCNAGELAMIANVPWQAKGVDSGSGDMDIAAVAQDVAKKYECLVIVTGEVDVVTDGVQVAHISGGAEMITRVTGSGCLLSAICAATLSVPGEPLSNIVATLQDYKHVAALADATHGTFQHNFFNALQQQAEVLV